MSGIRVTKFTYNPRVEGVIARSPAVARAVEATANAIRDQARENAPVRTGALRDSIETVTGVDERGAFARVVVRDFKGGWLEFGTERTRAQPYLRPAADAVVGPRFEGRS